MTASVSAFSVPLLVVTIIVAVIVLCANVYLIITFQHPEDRNQAWFPKLIVLFGLSLACWTLLMLPLDVANRATCPVGTALTSCNATFPMATLWYIVYMANIVLVFAAIPFAYFYYEADSDLYAGTSSSCTCNATQSTQNRPVIKRWLSGAAYGVLTFACMCLAVAIPYATIGFVEYPVMAVISGLAQPAALETNTTLCIEPGSTFGAPNTTAKYLCDALVSRKRSTWELPVTFPVYAMAISTTVGWVLFMMFAGVGFVSLPLGCLQTFAARPKATITRSEYISRAKDLAMQAKSIKSKADDLKKASFKQRGFGWRRRLQAISRELMLLEKQEVALSQVYPQGEDPELLWALTVAYYYAQLPLGVISATLSLLWLLQVVLYVFLGVHPFLNVLFVALDRAFGLLGVAAYAVFCFYLIAATISGCLKVGLNLLLVSIHPVKLGATLMNSMLFNTALVLLASTAAVQFCSTALGRYANVTAINDIYGNQLLHLRYIKVLYTRNVFLVVLFCFVLVGLLVCLVKRPKKWKRTTAEERLAEAYAA